MDFFIDDVGEESDSSSETEETPKSNTLVQALLKEYKENKLEEEITIQETDSNTKGKDKQKKEDTLVKEFIKEIGWGDDKRVKTQPRVTSVEGSHKHEAEEMLKKSVITPEFEKLHAVPRYDVSEKRLKLERKKEREKTKGKKWFGLPATEMTDEVKRDLEVIQMRSVLDPKHFYKKNDMKVLPKYFQVGKVMDSPLDYYNNRLTKKERKKTLVDELLADFEFKKYNKRKYKEIIQEKQKTHYKAWKQAKKLKKKK